MRGYHGTLPWPALSSPPGGMGSTLGTTWVFSPLVCLSWLPRRLAVGGSVVWGFGQQMPIFITGCNVCGVPVYGML